MALMRKNVIRRGRKSAAKATKKAISKSLTKLQKKEVKVLVKGSAETKRVAWYQSYNDGTISDKATGFYSASGFATQNNLISVNNTDILRLIPTLTQGIDDFNRIGTRVSVNSLVVTGAIRVSLPYRLANPDLIAPGNLRVCIYVLQHVQLKDYGNLYANNDFKQLLDSQEGGTVQFRGFPINEGMRVADQYYKVCHKKVISLKFAGSQVRSLETPVNNYFSIANAHTYYATYSMNLTKSLPKVLKYPEQISTTDPLVSAAPTNSSLFMCMGFVDEEQISVFNNSVGAKTWLEQTYVSNLTYKDM